VTGKPETVDAYIDGLSDAKRAALEHLRSSIKAVVPEAEECISYQLPAFRYKGKTLVGFGASAKHCAFYPMSPSTIEAHREELKDYSTSRGTIRFQADNPIPAALVRKLIETRIAEITANG